MDLSLTLQSRVQLTDGVCVELLSLARGVAKLAFQHSDSLAATYDDLISIRCCGRSFWWFPPGGPRLLVAQLSTGQRFKLGTAIDGLIEVVERQSVRLRIVRSPDNWKSTDNWDLERPPHIVIKEPSICGKPFSCKESHTGPSTQEIREQTDMLDGRFRVFTIVERELACLSRSGI